MKFAYAKRSSLGDPDKESQSFKDGIDEVGLFNIVTFDVEKVLQHILKSQACIFSLFPRHTIYSYYQKKKMNNIIYFIAGQEYDIIKLCWLRSIQNLGRLNTWHYVLRSDVLRPIKNRNITPGSFGAKWGCSLYNEYH